ncbi:MAG: hypothetical protein ABIH88_00290 [Patescibacteria group bacterium]|nr:hypothetical protein [Patescibacteria group bacterium]
MSIDNISQKTIPTFWAIILLFGLIGVFIIDSYNANKPEVVKENISQQKAEILDDFDFRGEENVPSSVHTIGGGQSKDEIYSYLGRLRTKTDMFLFIETKEEEIIKVRINENVSFYQMIKKDGVPVYLDFDDLKVGEEVEINFLKKAGETEFKTYAVIAKRYE